MNLLPSASGFEITGAQAWAVGTLLIGALLSVVLQWVFDRSSVTKRARAEASRYDSFDFAGKWTAIWQTQVDGVDRYYHDPVEIEQHQNVLTVKNESVAEDMAGGYLWKGELRLYDNHYLLGWYLANQPNVLSKGTFFFVVNRQGDLIEGGWTGCSNDSDLMSGCAVMARTVERADKAITRLRRDYRSSRVRKAR